MIYKAPTSVKNQADVVFTDKILECVCYVCVWFSFSRRVASRSCVARTLHSVQKSTSEDFMSNRRLQMKWGSYHVFCL